MICFVNSVLNQMYLGKIPYCEDYEQGSGDAVPEDSSGGGQNRHGKKIGVNVGVNSGVRDLIFLTYLTRDVEGTLDRRY